MKKIIKPGKKEFITICPTCGCQFKYEISDVSFNSVQCPECFHFVGHPHQDGGEDPEIEALYKTIRDFYKREGDKNAEIR